MLESFDESVAIQYNVVAITEMVLSGPKMAAMNEACRTNKVGFILTETMGAAGYIFLDYGDEFIITDDNGEQTKSFIVTNITQEEQGVCNVHEDKRHSF